MSTIAKSPPPPSHARAAGRPSDMRLASVTQDAFEAALDQLRQGDFFAGLTALSDADRWSAEQARQLIQAALARLKTERADDPAAQAKALATIAVILQLVREGAVPVQMFTGLLETALAELIDHLSGLEDLSTLARSGGRYGVPDAIQALVAGLDLSRNTLREIATAIFDQARLDPRSAPGPQTGAAASRFTAPATTPPTAGVMSAINLVASIEIEMDALIRSLELAGADASQSTLASLKARMELINMRMDIALGLLDQLTTLFNKLGQSFNR